MPLNSINNEHTQYIPYKRSFSLLEMNEVCLFVKLGCSESEREIPQEVRVQIHFQFLDKNESEETDQLEHTICYAEISHSIEASLKDQSFSLVEHLGFKIYQICKSLIPLNVLVQVSVHKVKPPVLSLKGGVKYTLGDLI